MKVEDMKHLTRIVIAAVLTLSGLPMLAQSPTQMDYDTYCKLPDVEAKRQAFMATTAEARGVLVRTHIERWRSVNKARLSDAQLTFLTELLASITPDTYADGPKGEEARQKARQLTAKANELFSRADNQEMQPNAPCIPKVK